MSSNMSNRMSQTYVLSIYPDARIREIPMGAKTILYRITVQDTDIGHGRSEDLAWQDAAQTLRLSTNIINNLEL